MIQAKTLITFLENRGWEVEVTTEKFYVLKPPTTLKFDVAFRIRIPVYENSMEYTIYMKMLIQGISKMYGMSEQALTDFLSIN